MRSGISKYKSCWRADITTNKTVKCLGIFSTKEAAQAAYNAEQAAMHRKRNGNIA